MKKINSFKKKEVNKFTKLLTQYKYNINKGDIVAGTIIYQEKSGFLINMGTQIAGYLPREEITINSYAYSCTDTFLVNLTREFFLISKHTNTNQPILSIKRLEYIRAWKRIKQLYLEDTLIKIKIKYINKGGLIIYLEGIQGFIPKSHIEIKNKDLIHCKISETYLNCKILTLNEQKNQLILSNKKAMLTSAKHKFKLGEIVYGKIISIKSYGIFLEIYGIKALLHISEIGPKYIKNMNTFFHLNKLIKIKIIHINIKQGKLSVSKRHMKY